MLIQKQSENAGGEPLKVRVEIPGPMVGKIKAYAEAAGYGKDLGELLVATAEYVLGRDREFHRQVREGVGRGRPRKKAAGSPTVAEPQGAPSTEPPKALAGGTGGDKDKPVENQGSGIFGRKIFGS